MDDWGNPIESEEPASKKATSAALDDWGNPIESSGSADKGPSASSGNDDSWGNPPSSSDNNNSWGNSNNRTNRPANRGPPASSGNNDGWGASSSSSNNNNDDWGGPSNTMNRSANRGPRASSSNNDSWGAPSNNDNDGWGGGNDSSKSFNKGGGGGGGGWGGSDQNNRQPRRSGPPRSSDDNGGGDGGWGASDHNDRPPRRDNDQSQNEGGEVAERPAPYKPEELNLEEETKLQADTVGENFKRYQEQTVTCLPPDLIKPIDKFEDVIESKLLLGNLANLKYAGMTPIQKWAMPAIIQGFDMIGCAQTGSGKTAAFLLPILQSIMKMDLSAQVDPNEDCQNPYCLIISPTRELTKQTYTHAEMLSRDSIVRSCFIYGQISTAHLRAQLGRGCHILVSTLGRLKDFLERGWIGFKNIKFIVLDEGDRLVEDGFSEDIKAILNHETMPPKEERQLLFFSATFKTNQQRIAKEYLRSRYVFITVGRVGAANEDIKQEFIEVSRPQKKKELKKILDQVPETDKTIIFTQTKANADILASYFSALQLSATSIHGDRHQSQREQAISSFRRGEKRFLISSPVGNRGLDLPKVALVINYDLPDSIDEYVHRIGRTGRAGHTGRAISFVDRERDTEILEPLIKILKEAKQEVPSWMEGSGAPQSSNDDWAAPNSAPNNDVPSGSGDDWGNTGSTEQPSTSTGPAGDCDDWGNSTNIQESSNKTTDGATSSTADNNDEWNTSNQANTNPSGGGLSKSFNSSSDWKSSNQNNRTSSGGGPRYSNRSTHFSYKDNPQNNRPPRQSHGNDSWSGSAPTSSNAGDSDWGANGATSEKRPADDVGGNPTKKLDQGVPVIHKPESPDFGDQEW